MQKDLWRFLALFMLTTLWAPETLAEHICGGDQNPGLETNAQALKKWQDARVGLSVHWTPVGLRGVEISWSRGGPFEPGMWGASTRRDNRIYVHVVSWPGEKLRLPALKERIKSARCLNGAKVEWLQSDAGLEISVSPAQRDPLDTIVELMVE